MRIKRFSEDLDFQMFKNLFGDIDNCSFEDESNCNPYVDAGQYPKFICNIEIHPYDINEFVTPKGVYDTMISINNNSEYDSLLTELDDTINTFKDEIKKYQKVIQANEKIKEIVDEIKEVILPRGKEYKNFNTMSVGILEQISVEVYLKYKKPK